MCNVSDDIQSNIKFAIDSGIESLKFDIDAIQSWLEDYPKCKAMVDVDKLNKLLEKDDIEVSWDNSKMFDDYGDTNKLEDYVNSLGSEYKNYCDMVDTIKKAHGSKEEYSIKFHDNKHYYYVHTVNGVDNNYYLDENNETLDFTSWFKIYKSKEDFGINMDQ
ncbi:hypothetical protein [Entomospira culicis]|uniref:Uncharacterized protein n=1 Tax=Entomospira culicis TaxID=2719989 RepID=A0A968KWJ9_9SPIO|nr:hypothetical protein [Entomospira culicis]NIZ19093.1 hypothetical protein [Entomospira culicis]NIZ69307.1 hypothetical protein [Entomospira culicis]WDI37893.1 hypothetical protein PVA46_03650 [Entomospira culicis]WDI39520.1 hypothetical protein PVA47_03650 [Entomospira culicis]